MNIKKIIICVVFVCTLGIWNQSEAQYYSFCSDQIIALKAGLIGGDLGVGIEQRCGGQDGGIYTFSGIDYATQKGSSITAGGVTTNSPRSHYLALGGGLGYNFSDVVGVEDLHPFLGLGFLLSTTIVNKDFSGAAGIQVPVGVDYLVTEGIALGVEYSYNHLWDFQGTGVSGGTSEIMLRVGFWI